MGRATLFYFADTVHLFDNARGDVEALIYLVVE